jgi:hypothetical protein
MNTVASKRLFQEYKHLTTDPPDGITAGPVNEDDLFVWEAMILGPEGTPYEGGVFPAELKFPKDYPLMPPTMKFLCDIWHPNGTNTFILTRRKHHTDLMRLDSIPQRRSLHIYPTPTRRRPEPLRAGFRALESNPKRGEDFD